MATTASNLGLDGVPAADGSELESSPAAITTVPAGAGQPVGPLEAPFDVQEIGQSGPAEELIDEPSKAGQRLARNLGALVGGQAITWTFTLIWTLIVPRAIGPVGFGILVSAQSVSGVLGIGLGLGAREYLVRETVLRPASGPRLVGTVFVLRIALVPIVGAAAVVWAQLAHYGRDATIVLYLITAMTVFTWLLDSLQAAFQAIERMQYIAYGNVVNKVAQGIAGIGLVLVGFKEVGIAAEMAMVVGLVMLLSFWWLRPYFRVDVRTNLTSIGRVARDSLAYWATGLFWMIYFWIDTIMLTLMTHSTVVGWYGASTQLFQTLMFLPALVQTAWLPRLVAAFGNSRRDLHKTARAPLELLLMLSLPIAAGTVVVAGELIRLVYGAAFAHAVPVMAVLALCIPPIYVNMTLSSVLVAEKRQLTWTMVMAGAAVVNPLFNLVLIPATTHWYGNGAIGAAVSLVLTEVLMAAVGVLLVGHRVFDRRVVKRCALMAVASVGLVVAAQSTRPFGTVTAYVAGAAAFGLLVTLLRIVTSEEVALARSWIAGVQARLRRNRFRRRRQSM